MNGRRWLGALAVLALAAVLRLPALDADPPPDFHFSFIADEGAYAHNARLKSLTGVWTWDAFDAPLYTAPLHTWLVERAYAALGRGLASTRLPGALAGVFVALMLVALPSRRVAPETALTAGLLAAACGFLVAHARVAYTESLQLAGVTLAVLGVWRARTRPGWAVFAALGLVAALLAKLSSAPVLLVVIVQWVMFGAEARERGDLPGWLRGLTLFTGTLIIAALALGVCFVLPHADAIRAAWREMARLATSTGHDLPLLTRFLWFGFREDPGGLRSPGGFFAGEPAIVIAAGWLGTAALLGRRSGGDRFLVRSCWAWAVILLAAIATHPALSPDRRYVLLVPPVLLLMAMAAFEPAARADDRPVTHETLRAGLAWAVATLVIGIILRPAVLTFLTRATAGLPIGRESGMSPRAMLALGWLTAAALAALLLRSTALRETLRPAPGFARLLVLWALAGGIAAGATQFAHARYTIRDASRAIGTIASHLPPGRRIAIGETAETFALENDLRCMVVRDWPYAGVRINVEAVPRIDPPFAILTRAGRRPVTGMDAAPGADAVPLGRWPVWTGVAGVPQLTTTLYARHAQAARQASR